MQEPSSLLPLALLHWSIQGQVPQVFCLCSPFSPPPLSLPLPQVAPLLCLLALLVLADAGPFQLLASTSPVLAELSPDFPGVTPGRWILPALPSSSSLPVLFPHPGSLYRCAQAPTLVLAAALPGAAPLSSSPSIFLSLLLGAFVLLLAGTYLGAG